MTRGQALAGVARYTAGLLRSGDIETATGLTQGDQSKLSDSDIERIAWAITEVARRLDRMGTQK